MQIKISYDNKFVELWNILQEKYPMELFELDGVSNSRLDINKFSKDFFSSKENENVSDVSVDSNSNVAQKNSITYNSEVSKAILRLNSYYLLWKETKEKYTLEKANEIVEKSLNKSLYINDFHAFTRAYCFNFSTYDLVVNGLTYDPKIKSAPPKHLSSFIGQLCASFIPYASNSIAGACGLSDFLISATWFIKKELENDEILNKFSENEQVVKERKKQLWKQFKQEFQSFIYSVNQPARGGIESAFTNVSIFDEKFFKDLAKNYIFPDGVQGDSLWSLAKKVQLLFLDIYNDTMKNTVITFPVVTSCHSIDEEKNIIDKQWLETICEKNLEFAFINFYRGKSSTLSSCCRLRSDSEKLQKNFESIGYSNSIGGTASKIGSYGVVTVNFPRLAIISKTPEVFIEKVKEIANDVFLINDIKRKILQERIETGKFPLYTLNFMSLESQYSTFGFNGLYEALEILGLNILKKDGITFAKKLFTELNYLINTKQEELGYVLNIEQTPSENSSIVLAKTDKLLGFQTEWSLYSNQFVPLILDTDILNRMKIQGELDGYMSGGSILHINVDNKIKEPSKLVSLLEHDTKMGTVYSAINYQLNACNKGHVTVGRNPETCSVCGEKIVDKFLRVVGFITRVRAWKKERREEFEKRGFYKEEKLKDEYSTT